MKKKNISASAKRKKNAANQRAWYRKNRKMILKKVTAYRRKNRKKVSAYQKAYQKIYRKKNIKELAKKQKAYRQENFEKVTANSTDTGGRYCTGYARMKYRLKAGANWRLWSAPRMISIRLSPYKAHLARLP